MKQKIEIPADDLEFDELPLEDVRKEGKSYVLKREGWSLGIDDPGFVPKVGMLARYYGRGIGFPVRGVVVNGVVCFYKTPAEQEEIHRQQSEKFERETKEREAEVAAFGRTEKAMREEEAPWPKTIEELSAYIQKQVDGPHDYGTCCYATSLSAVAAFHFVSHVLGITGFQASCADLDMVRRTRRIDGPFMLLKAEDMLYPQYDLEEKLQKAMESWKPWLQEQAAKKITERGEAHPKVVAHWKKLSVAK